MMIENSIKTSDTDSKILELIKTYDHPIGHFGRFLKNTHKEYYEYIDNLFPMLKDYNFIQKLYWFVNNLKDFPPCEVCGNPNKIKIKTFEKGYGLCVCSISCSNLHPKTKEKIRVTNIEKYGCENPFGNKEVKQKIKDSNLKKYGVENPSQSKEVYKKIENTMLERYGVKCSMHSDELKSRLAETNLKKYGSISPLKNKDIRQKCSDTNLLLYGVDNPFSSKEIQDKIKNTNIEKYGVENPNQNKDIVQKSQETCLIRYGVRYPTQNSDIMERARRNKMKTYYTDILMNNSLITPNFTLDEFLKNPFGELSWICKTCNKEFKGCRDLNWKGVSRCYNCYPILTGTSKPEQELQEYIKSVLPNSIILTNESSVIKPYELDVYVPEVSTAIEFNGLVWHSEKYKGLPINDKTQKCLDKGIRLVHVFEDEWNLKKDIVKSRICSILNINQTKIFARKCEILPTSWDDTRKFLEENHIQGSCNSSINLGLYFEGILISVMTFGSLRKALGHSSKDGNFELLRFCSKLNHNVVGGASKLLKYFIRNHNPKVIISYADRRWSIGNVYEKLGFKLSHVSKPNYWYIVKGNREHRFKWRKDQLPKLLKTFDASKSERENMADNGYFRIYDCGHRVYVLNQ